MKAMLAGAINWWGVWVRRFYGIDETFGLAGVRDISGRSASGSLPRGGGCNCNRQGGEGEVDRLRREKLGVFCGEVRLKNARESSRRDRMTNLFRKLDNSMILALFLRLALR